MEILSWHFYSFFFSNTRGLPNGTTPGCPCALGAPGLCSLPRGQPRLTQCFPSQPVSRVETRAPNTNWRLIALERSFTWAGNAVVLRTGRRGGGVRSHGAQRVALLLPGSPSVLGPQVGLPVPPAWSPPLQLPHSTAAPTTLVEGTLGDQHSLCPH